jgi:hypothetical protein
MRALTRLLPLPLGLVALMAALGAAAAQDATGTIQIVQGGTGIGTVTSDPAGIDCTLGGPDGPTGTCSATFDAGTRVRLRAVAADGSRFEGWAPVTSCPKPKNLTVEAGRTHTCQPVFSFTEPPELLLQAFLEGSGTVTSDPAGIACTADEDAGTLSGQCGSLFPNGSVVTLTATPAAGWVFQGWSAVERDRDCADGVVTMDEAHACVATFVRA